MHKRKCVEEFACKADKRESELEQMVANLGTALVETKSKVEGKLGYC